MPDRHGLFESDRSQLFSYDELNRVRTAQTQATTGRYSWGLQFGYDIWANLLSASVTQGSAPMLSVSVDASNRIIGNGYDAAGNMTSAPGMGSYTYDAENRMTATAGVTYTYDGDGKRVQKSNGKLYWYGMGSDPLVESNLAGTLSDEYIFFNGKRVARRIVSSGQVNYYFSDHLSTSRVVTNATGTILDDSDFYPFGGERVVTSTSGNTYKFTGKERDAESGLDYFGARYYASSMGRYLSPDWNESPQPVPYADFGNPQTLNLYQYVGNNPIKTFDADGHCWPPSACADALDSFVQTFRQDGLAANDRTSSPTLAAINTFANGVVGDLASGAADVLRLGNGTAAAIDSAKQGDYAGAAVGLAEDGGRAAGVILAVVGVAGRGTQGSSGVPKEGIYEGADATAPGRTYVGQSENIPRRLGEQKAAGRFPEGTRTTTKEVKGGKTAREIAEQKRINELGGVRSVPGSKTSNIRNPIGRARKPLLKDPEAK